MRKFILSALVLTMSLTAVADDGAKLALQRVAQYVDMLGSYDAEFNVSAGEYKTQGRYSVAGDSYYIILDASEVYSDGKVRYEVDNGRKEINVDNMDLTSRNVLDNPTRCFDFVDSDYVSNIHLKSDDSITIHLRSNDPAIEGDIYLTIDAASACPQKLEYKLYDDVIQVDVVSLNKRKDKIKNLDKSKYKDYEIIDFR